MNMLGVSKTCTVNHEILKDHLDDAQSGLKKNLDAIDEAYTGVTRLKFDPGYEGSYDGMSSPASFDSETGGSVGSKGESEGSKGKKVWSGENDNTKSGSKESPGPSVSGKDHDKQSPVDFVLEKKSTEMPDIADSDGGGD